MLQFKYHVGVDVSKKTLDIYCHQIKQHIQIENNSNGFKVFMKWTKSFNMKPSEFIVAMEHTGGYEYKLIQFCGSKNIKFIRISGLEIKKSMGITRGKNDRIDAQRISKYVYEKKDDLEPTKPLDLDILKIRQLLTLRKRLVRENAGYKTTIVGKKDMFDTGNADLTIKILKAKIEANEQHIELIQKEIETCILTNDEICKNYKLLTSIKGIGFVNAVMTIVFTENFTSFDNARAYAVYVGVVPFEHKSGSSIKGKTRTSNIANKEAKQELNMAARAAVLHDEEIRDYAARLEHRNKIYPVILNNVKFKLILRMFAVVKKGELYVEKRKQSA